MNGLPTHCNTRTDYDYIRSTAIPGWEGLWKQLLEGRFMVAGDDLVEDPQAPIFRLGLTVDEVAQAINISGLTDRELEWRASQPDRWRLVDGEWIELDGWQAARTAAKMAEAASAKIAEIEAESRRRQLADIPWNGHSWYADAWATKTIESCCAVATALGMADTDLIRVPPPLQPGYWMSADVDASGNRIIVPLTVAEMRQLLAALYDRNGAIWGKEVIHKATIEAMVAMGATPDQVSAYDISLGWE
jgi:3',5'-cyclic AMP phosphodiesterase CpdA